MPLQSSYKILLWLKPPIIYFISSSRVNAGGQGSQQPVPSQGNLRLRYNPVGFGLEREALPREVSTCRLQQQARRFAFQIICLINEKKYLFIKEKGYIHILGAVRDSFLDWRKTRIGVSLHRHNLSSEFSEIIFRDFIHGGCKEVSVPPAEGCLWCQMSPKEEIKQDVTSVVLL